MFNTKKRLAVLEARNDQNEKTIASLMLHMKATEEKLDVTRVNINDVHEMVNKLLDMVETMRRTIEEKESGNG